MKELRDRRAKCIPEVTQLSGELVLFSFHCTVLNTAIQSFPTLSPRVTHSNGCHDRMMGKEACGLGPLLWAYMVTQNLTGKTPWHMFKKSVHQFIGDLLWWFPYFQNLRNFKNADSRASSKTYWLNCFQLQVTKNTHPNSLNRNFRGW